SAGGHIREVELLGQESLKQVDFPDCKDIPSNKQHFYMHQLLDTQDYGLSFQLQGENLYTIQPDGGKCSGVSLVPYPRAPTSNHPIENEIQTLQPQAFSLSSSHSKRATPTHNHDL
ncbi:hypothetical protein P7K49_026944, partial [Saguinus oedipus]